MGGLSSRIGSLDVGARYFKPGSILRFTRGEARIDLTYGFAVRSRTTEIEYDRTILQKHWVIVVNAIFLPGHDPFPNPNRYKPFVPFSFIQRCGSKPGYWPHRLALT